METFFCSAYEFLTNLDATNSLSNNHTTFPLGFVYQECADVTCRIGLVYRYEDINVGTSKRVQA